MLTSRQRVLNALTYTGCDRLPTFYQATPEFDAELKQHLGVTAAEAAAEAAALGRAPWRSTTRWTPSSAST